ncbi:MAG: glycoside hydrolase family 25 protein [Bellilinea sp.]
MNALGVDVSRWQRSVDWKLLRKAGVTFANVKASQGTQLRDQLLRSHFSGARNAGMVTGVYHWIDPILPAARQIDHFMAVCSGLDFDFAALDVEQYWQSWQEWAENRIVRCFEPESISACAREAAQTLRAAIKKPVVIYTRLSFVKTYAEPMQDWLSGWPLWLAFYPYPSGRVNVSWESLQHEHLPKRKGPDLPGGASDWHFWQFSGDRFVLPGADSPLDLSFFNGSEERLRAWCGAGSAAESEISDAEKLRLLWEAHPELRRP